MQDNYSITRLDTGDNLITIDIQLNEDGGLTISDWCCGTAAETFYGSDDVESNLTIDHDAVCKLYEVLTGTKLTGAAKELAEFLQINKKGNTKILSWLKDICAKNKIKYDWVFWP